MRHKHVGCADLVVLLMSIVVPSLKSEVSDLPIGPRLSSMELHQILRSPLIDHDDSHDYDYGLDYSENPSKVPNQWSRVTSDVLPKPMRVSLAFESSSQQEFNFKDKVSINKQIIKPKLRKTGTTIVGCVCHDPETDESFVVLAADSRATDGSTVADKRCAKIHKLSYNVACCGAGTSADNDALMRQIQYGLKLGQLTYAQPVLRCYDYSPPPARVMAVCRRIREELYASGGQLGVNLILGGYDALLRQALLFAIHPHGSMDQVPYAALGSGGLAAMGVLESQYTQNLTLNQTISLVQAAVSAGIHNDLGSGGQVDICILGRKTAIYHRAKVPEQSLPTTIYTVPVTPHQGEQGRSGVNGFGNLRFSIRTIRTILPSEQELANLANQWWTDTLQD